MPAAVWTAMMSLSGALLVTGCVTGVLTSLGTVLVEGAEVVGADVGVGGVRDALMLVVRAAVAA
jgi:hypothetical protein